MANFINNVEFLALLREYKVTKDETSEKFDLKRNRDVYNRIGEIFLDMTNRLLYHPRFCNYTDDWKNDMVSEAVYNCCRYVDTYDTTRGTSPFAYFTQTIWNSFWQITNKERKLKSRRDDMVSEVWNHISFNPEEGELNKLGFGIDE